MCCFAAEAEQSHVGPTATNRPARAGDLAAAQSFPHRLKKNQLFAWKEF